MRELPPGWAWTTLGELAELKGGLTKGKRRRDEERLRPVPYLRVENVQRGYLNLDEVKLIEATEAEIENLRLRVGDVLFNEGGDRDKLGRGWVWEAPLPECIHQNHVFRARLRSQHIQPRFLSWYGNSEGAKYFNDQGKQTTNLASINLTNLSEFPVPLPPASEQRRVVAEIEKQLSTLDSATANLDLVASKAALYRNSYLNTIFGSTSPYSLDPEARESGAALAEVLQERRALRRGRLTVEPIPPESVEHLPLPPGWIVASIDQVCSQVTDGEHIQPPYQESGFPMLSATHVRGDSVTFAKAGLISTEAFAFARSRCAPAKGDILVVSVGATTGRVGKVNTMEPFALVRSVLLLKPLINADFLLRWLQSLRAQKWIKRASGSTAQPHLYIRDIKRMPIPFAPVPVQDRAASAIEERLSDLAELEATVQKVASRAAHLRQAILKKAFEGKLVPQDPNDEPASVLLDRIRATRAHSSARARAIR